jgi:hypothetical protein
MDAVSPQRFKEIQERYERMRDWDSDTVGLADACAAAYSIDVPALIAEVKRLQGAVEFERARNRGLVR